MQFKVQAFFVGGFNARKYIVTLETDSRVMVDDWLAEQKEQPLFRTALIYMEGALLEVINAV